MVFKMNKLLLSFFILCLIYSVKALEDNAPEANAEDYEYYDNDWYDEMNKLNEGDKNEPGQPQDKFDYPDDRRKDLESDVVHDMQVEEEIQGNLEELNAQKALDDYQFEDNRSEIKEDAQDVLKEQPAEDSVKSGPENVNQNVEEVKEFENINEDGLDAPNINDYGNFEADNSNEYNNNNEQPKMHDEFSENAENEFNQDDIVYDEPEENDLRENQHIQEAVNPQKENIFDETKQILEEVNNDFEGDSNQNVEGINDNIDEKPGKPLMVDEENVAKDSVQQLSAETFAEENAKNADNNENNIDDRFSEEIVENEEKDKPDDNMQNPEAVKDEVVSDAQDPEEDDELAVHNQDPEQEGNVENIQEPEIVIDAPVVNIQAPEVEMDTPVENKDGKYDEVAEGIQDPELFMLESPNINSDKQFNELKNELNYEENSADVIEENQNSDDYEKVEDSNLGKIFLDKEVEIDNDKFDLLNVNVDEIGKIVEDQEQGISREALRNILPTNPDNQDAIPDPLINKNKDDAEKQSVDVNDLNSAELHNLMKDFAVLHEDEINSPVRDSTPIHIEINPDTAVEVTSPNYPANYPTNNVIEWILDGEGRGIELNITNFSVNGALGDYVLIKPGGIDTSPEDSIIFSYRLNSERKYRFVDTNSLYIKFEAKQGMAFMNGFRFRVKMLREPAEPFIEDEESDDVLPTVEHSIAVYLQGLTQLEFQSVKEEFRIIIADMALLYTIEAKIPAGLNKTRDTTQIIKQGICQKNWPDFDTCVKVHFGVPLVYADEEETRLNEEDLETMWRKYVQIDPYNSRLRMLGLRERPNADRHAVLMHWSLIAGGVILLASIVSFALWRFSCFENYTRMPIYSDTDSNYNEKQDLDLYPTPHQTLPPLYSDHEYSWEKYDDSTRVDMGGFTNKSYLGEDLFNIDSDEEAVMPRPRDRVATDV